MTLSTLFTNPIILDGGHWTLWLVIPLCCSVAVVYKTIRTESLHRLPMEALVLIAYMVVGLAALAGGLWLLMLIAL